MDTNQKHWDCAEAIWSAAARLRFGAPFENHSGKFFHALSFNREAKAVSCRRTPKMNANRPIKTVEMRPACRFSFVLICVHSWLPNHPGSIMPVEQPIKRARPRRFFNRARVQPRGHIEVQV
jgi:hypothetical protein